MANNATDSMDNTDQQATKSSGFGVHEALDARLAESVASATTGAGKNEQKVVMTDAARSSFSAGEAPDYSLISKMAEDMPTQGAPSWWQRLLRRKTTSPESDGAPSVRVPKQHPPLSPGLEPDWVTREEVDTSEAGEETRDGPAPWWMFKRKSASDPKVEDEILQTPEDDTQTPSHSEDSSADAAAGDSISEPEGASRDSQPTILDDLSEPPEALKLDTNSLQPYEDLSLPPVDESVASSSFTVDYEASADAQPAELGSKPAETKPESVNPLEPEPEPQPETEPATELQREPEPEPEPESKLAEPYPETYSEPVKSKPPDTLLRDDAPIDIDLPGYDGELKINGGISNNSIDGTSFTKRFNGAQRSEEKEAGSITNSRFTETLLTIVLFGLIGCLPWAQGSIPDLLSQSAMRYMALALGLAGILLNIYVLYRDNKADDWREYDDLAEDSHAVSRQQPIETEEQSRKEENGAVYSQESVMQLMDQLDAVARGDLTVHATVTEDNIGTIADFVNYTIEEFRSVVVSINEAVTQIDGATRDTHKISSELLLSAQEQAEKIRDAGRAALDVARRMNEASGEAKRTAQAAEMSMNAAVRGALAVEDSVHGMDEIRDTIQETAKRIKRLGESSLEIGEITEIITGITEQTNVLAINAAIQAASAGEAGRGFSVVAEEVQRLAERSAEATRQIAMLIKSIQSDTRSAVEAMENTTQNVVEGGKKTRFAGEALSQIREVSQRMSSLINSIALLTQAQSRAASNVAKRMQDIHRFTRQTTDGTHMTDNAVGDLATLSSRLQDTVARFKID